VPITKSVKKVTKKSKTKNRAKGTILRGHLRPGGPGFDEEHQRNAYPGKDSPENKGQAGVDALEAIAQRGRQEGTDHGNGVGQTDSRPAINAADVFYFE